MSTAVAELGTDTPPVALSHRLGRLASHRPAQIIAVEVALILLFQALSPDGAFLSTANIRGMLLTASQVVLLAAAQAVLMSAGQIDISQGAALILSSVVAGKVMIAAQDTLPVTATLLLGLAVAVVTGVLVGAANGMLVAVVRINALVATLGMLSVASGAAEVITGGVNLFGFPSEVAELGSVRFGAIPLVTVVSLLVVGVVWALYGSTRWGTHTLAMGSNLQAARRVGIRTLPHTVGIFVLSSALAGLAGYIDLTRYSTTNISGHLNDSMAAIAAALIGGTALTGGRISFLGAVVGALLAIILQSGLVIIDISPFYQTIAIGLMLLVAVGLDRAATGSRAAP
ncbi:MAG TPA: ABC transporter permease [Cellulomonas sp.]